MIYRRWWKYLGIILILYTLIAGLAVPLRPGIAAIEHEKPVLGESLEINITGYNTHWDKTKSQNTRAWLKYNDAYSLGAGSVSIIDYNNLKVIFDLPVDIPGNAKVVPFTLITDDLENGSLVLPNALFIASERNDKNQDLSAVWQQNPIENLQFKKRFAFPYRNLLVETIRNQYYHVPLWFAMIIIFAFSVVKSVQNLRSYESWREQHILALNYTGLVFGLLGLATGMLWAQYTWGKFWNWDVKQTMALIAVLIYASYFLLRSGMGDREVRARVSDVYNVFAFAMLIPLLFVIPRMTDSLHPGAGGNPAFGGDDLDYTMRLVFYPAVIGWTILGMWLASLKARYLIIQETWRSSARYN